jgi:putative PEP-CTERM system TPR-repeat lipoprotein
MSQPRSFPRLSVVLVAAALAFTGASASAQTSKEKAARFYEDALTRFEKKDIPGTIIQLKNALQADKTLLPVQLLLGRALMMDGQAVAAEVAITEALRLGVDRAEVVVTLGQSLLAQGKHQQLLEQPRMAPAGLPNGVRQQVLLQRVTAYADQGDTANALRTLEEARNIDKNAAEVWTAEIPLRLRNRQYKEALAAADMALKLAPDAAEAHYQKATIAHSRADAATALAGYTKALSLDPNHSEARIARAGLNLDLKRDADAQADIDEARKRSPREPRAAYLRAVLSEKQGDRATAKAALQDVVALLDPVPIEFIRYRPQLMLLNGLAHYALEETGKAKPFLESFYRSQPATPVAKLLGQIYMQEKTPEKTIEVLEAYLRGYPGDGQALTQLAVAHLAKGRPAKAAQLMQDALKAKDAPEYRTALGLSLIQSGDVGAATKELQAAFKKDPRQMQAGMSLIGLHLREGRPQDAVVIADQLVRQQPTNPVVLNLAGVAKAQSGDFAGARRAFESALVADRNLLSAKLGLARIDIATKAFDSAMFRLKELLKADERNTEALYDMAVLQERLGKPDEAQRWLERAAEVSAKNDPAPNYALVELHLRQGRASQALEAAKALLAKLPEDVRALSTYARAQIASGDAAGAKQSLLNASRRAGFDAAQQAEVAALQLDLGDLDNAAYSLDKALSNSPDHLAANVLMTSVEIRHNELAKAEARAKRIVASHAKLPVGYQLLGDIASARGQNGAAADAYRQAHRNRPSSATALSLIKLLSAQGAGNEAKAVADGWLKSNPRDLAVRRALADHLARTGDYRRARTEYETAIKQGTADAELLNNLANVHLQLKDAKAAVSAAEQALAAAPSNPVVIDTLGWALFKDGRFDAALLKLRDARLRAPANPEIRFHLASALAQSGKRAEAREELVNAFRDHPHFPGEAEAKALLETLK